MADTCPTILQIIPRLDTGGAELSTIEITEAIARAGGRALVATEGGRMADRVSQAGGTLIPFPAGTKNPLRILANAQAMGAMIATHGVQLIHARSRAPAWSGLIAAKRAGIPFVTTYHGAYTEKGRLKRLYNSVMARADIVIANSEFTADLVRTRYATPENRIRVIHRGVDIGRFDPGGVPTDDIAEIRRAWGIEPHARIVLQAARLTSWKGQGVLIAAVDRLYRAGHFANAVVVLAGDRQGRDGYAETLRREIARRGLQDVVRLVGHVDDMATAFAAAHVTVIASIEPEAFGRTATEAQALGCPVIATDIGAPRETVLASPQVDAQAVTGWLVPPGNAEALADRLAEALGMSSTERAAMAVRARARVAEHFTLEAMKAKTLGVYDELLGSRLRSGLHDRTPVRPRL